MNFVRRAIWLLFIGCAFSSAVRIERVPSPRSLCGEGPHWDVATQSLYYIDIYGPESTILRYDFNEDKTYAATVDNEPLMTFVLPIEGTCDEFLIGTNSTAKVIRWDGKSPKGECIRDAFQVDDIPTNRFNDAKCDPSGRFFGGTQRFAECEGPFNLPNASLYSYDCKHGVRKWRSNVFISNGLTWNTKTNKFYYIDSCSHELIEYDYNSETGDISNERMIYSLKENGAAPGYVFDGMTSDLDGNLFIATFNGHKVMKINPTNGRLLAEYSFGPIAQITSAAFGGPNLDILFVTTASRGDQSNVPGAGHLHKITGLCSKGTPSVKVKL